MNYRHAFHAGNFADCHKHALLLWLLAAMARKPAGFLMLDTHAGSGRYDLAAHPNREWERGAGRVLNDDSPALAPYRAQLGRETCPGSPAIALAQLRPQDRLAACELHPEEFAALRRTLRGAPNAAAHHRDGWEALRGLLPAPERRALVLVDPPYEETGEHLRLARALLEARLRAPGAVLAGWYPIKSRAPARALLDTLRDGGARDVVATELLRHQPVDPARLNGSGLVLINPPYRFEEEARPVMAALARLLGEGYAVERVVEE